MVGLLPPSEYNEKENMEANFWHQRWEANQIAFHQGEVNPLLISCFDRLSLCENSRIFIPLCGKTLDIGWLLSKGYRVVGAELSEIAIEQLFEELGVTPKLDQVGEFIRYSGENIEVFVGDFFDLTPGLLGRVDAVYDRAALIALPEPMREAYAAQLLRLAPGAPRLLLTIEYDPSQLNGPPFSVPAEEVEQRYAKDYRLEQLEAVAITLKGKCAAVEKAWLVRP